MQFLRRQVMTSMCNHPATPNLSCEHIRHAGMQACSVEPVAALISQLVKTDGGRLLLADPLERTRKHRRGCVCWVSCPAGR